MSQDRTSGAGIPAGRIPLPVPEITGIIKVKSVKEERDRKSEREPEIPTGG
jgi:hypothetical protein